ncbi:hypothetical protein M0D69_27935 [Caballeronia sp. SEWSISQ10-4 2]|uniref:aspartate racemase/maleate isomerase family protein n=1 Tax=Caballeronia sp. SEWSISQ10-4 2 TaxID=2937438 RepID=UPI00264EF8C2|nr:hypothetical protein [Caballeronia sp. SEWSISQ10-4 2]MDN7181769.1 hypothetical protein [Caballeronia sp. SEWSISQ10-4 2]
MAELQCFPNVRRLGILTSYQPVGDANVSRFFEESGYDVAAVHSLKRPSEVQIAHATGDIAALAALNVDALVQVGTDLAVGDLVTSAKQSLGIPVIAINTATYWLALKRSGIADRLPGHGRLTTDF